MTAIFKRFVERRQARAAKAEHDGDSARARQLRVEDPSLVSHDGDLFAFLKSAPRESVDTIRRKRKKQHADLERLAQEEDVAEDDSLARHAGLSRKRDRPHHEGTTDEFETCTLEERITYGREQVEALVRDEAPRWKSWPLEPAIAAEYAEYLRGEPEGRVVQNVWKHMTKRLTDEHDELVSMEEE